MNWDRLERLDVVDLLMSHRIQRETAGGSAVPRIDLAALRAALAATPQDVVDRLVEDTERIRHGQHALDLAKELLGVGQVERARYWLSVAVESDIDDAATLIDAEPVEPADADQDTFLNGYQNVPDAESLIIKALAKAKESAEAALKDSELRFEELFTTSSVGMAISDMDGVLIRTNRALADILGCQGKLEAGKLGELFHPEDADYLRLRYEVLLDESSLPFRERRRLLRVDGEEALVFWSASVLRDPDGTPRYHVTTVEDVSARHFLESQIMYMATHDALTGLVNRQRFRRRVEEALSGDTDYGLTVFHLNLDGFRAINNGLGRDAGDRLLQVVATRLRDVFAGENVTLARLDGDEFGVLLEHSPTTPSIAALAARINDELVEPVYIEGQGIATTATIAVIHGPSASRVPEELLRATGTVLGRLKAGGRRQWAMVDDMANKYDQARFTLASSLPSAWEGGEIALEYRPLITVADRGVVAVQAMLRWDHAEHGRLGHQRCLEVLAETGLAVPIGQWMLASACEQLRAWINQNRGQVPKLYVELTKEFAGDPDLVSIVHSALMDSDIPPKQVQLGMPVQALCMRDGLAEDNLDVLVDLGIDVVLYEFGTTRGDLACLEDLPVSAVKMSLRVVSRVDQMGDGALFTRAIRELVPLVREAGTPVMVGDIDTEAQYRWWRDAGADTVQGAYVQAGDHHDVNGTRTPQP